MKKYIIIIALCLIAGASLNAWHGGWRGRGWGPGWGWGPSVGFTVPIGGSSPKYIVPTRAGDPYSRYVSLFPKANPMKNPNAYHQWLITNYPQDADRWWNEFVGKYNVYQADRPRSSGYLSVGTGGGYWGSPYWGGPYWGGPGVSFGVGF